MGRDTSRKTPESVLLGPTELFTDLEQLAPLELAKQHTDRYYTKVIKTFVSIIKRQFADRQLLLVNTVHCLKFLEKYSDRQAQIWKIFYKHYNIPDDLGDLHLHFDNFQTSLETDFKGSNISQYIKHTNVTQPATDILFFIVLSCQ